MTVSTCIRNARMNAIRCKDPRLSYSATWNSATLLGRQAWMA